MPVIEIDNLWKKYRLGVIGHGTLRQDLQSWWAKMRGKEDPNTIIPLPQGQTGQIEGNRFWALKHINLGIEQGDILGIIGKNGAGKSTLLKILSRVTSPTRGTIRVKGRIASLLEVGTGFHPELTGRENVFLNGAILGLSKQEIKGRLDEIIAFSGIEAFIDTPVKRYSSGMYVRLAFAVAAHLDPDILVVDEVLAIGDAEFQSKCLGKMGEAGKQGRTLLFVSHNLPMLSKLCPKSVLLRNGEIVSAGKSSLVIDEYLKDIARAGSRDLTQVVEREGFGYVRFTKMVYLNRDMKEVDIAQAGGTLVIRLYFTISEIIINRAARFSIGISHMGRELIHLDTSLVYQGALTLKKSDHIDFFIPKLPLGPAKYNTTVFVEAAGQVQDWIKSGPVLAVEGGSFFGSDRNNIPGFEGKHVLVEHSVKVPWQEISVG
jgi:lipopolysaccharide transport system ATP-binding protein